MYIVIITLCKDVPFESEKGALPKAIDLTNVIVGTGVCPSSLNLPFFLIAWDP